MVNYIKALGVLVLLNFVIVGSSFSQKGDVVILFKDKAKNFTESLPLGNGRLGVMVFGNTGRERLVLNEISLWSGGPEDGDNEEAHKYLNDIQQYLLVGKNREAQQLLQKHFVAKGRGSGEGSGANDKYGCYQTMGDLFIDWADTAATVSDYQKWLDLESALVTSRFTRGGVTYKEEVFTDFVNDIT